MKALLTFLGVVLMLSPAIASPEMIFISDGKPVVVEPKDQQRITKKIEEIVMSANFNSRDHRVMFAKADTAYWRPLAEIAAGSYILLRYAEPHDFETVGGKIPTREVWVDLQDKPRTGGGAVYPGPITLANEGDLVKLTKEGGYLVMGLGLDPAVFPHLPKIIQENMDRSRKAYEEYQKQNKG